MYSKEFSAIYNLFGWNYYPEAFFDQLIRLQPLPESCLDIGCGTGVLCELLARQGVRTLGIDLSDSMIEVARMRCPNNRYEVADMVTFTSDERFELITCTGDALNHIHSCEEVEQVFRHVLDMLLPGGLFLFDVLSGKEIDTSSPIELDYDEHTHASFSMTRCGSREVLLHIRSEHDGTETVNELIRETLYPPEELHTMLERVGFKHIECRTSLLNEPATDSTTLYFLAYAPV